MTGKLLKIDGIWIIKYFDDMKGYLEFILCDDDSVMLNSHSSAALNSANTYVDFKLIEIEGKEYAKLIGEYSSLIKLDNAKSSIIFHLESESPKEVIRIQEGKFYFKGEEIEDINKVYDKMNWFFDKSKENYPSKTITDEEISIAANDLTIDFSTMSAFKLGAEWAIEQLKSK